MCRDTSGEFMPTISRRARYTAFGCGLSIAGLVLSACSSSSGSSSSAAAPAGSGSTASGSGPVAYADAALAAARAVPAFTLTAPKFDMAKIAGKKIFNIPISSQIPYVVAVDQSAEKIAKKYGATWVEYTNQGSPTEWASGIAQAISQKADVILLAQGIDPTLLTAPLAQAKAAHIPVILTHTLENGQALPSSVQNLITAVANVPFHEAAKLEADYAISTGKGKAKVLIITSNEVPPSKAIVTAMQAELSAQCPDCSSTVVNVPVADWATKISTSVQSALRTNPNIDVILPIYDSMSIYAQSGITAASATGKVTMASYNGTPAILKMVQDKSSLKMDVGESIDWLGYATMDQTGRVLTGAGPIADGDEDTPLRVIDASNISETGTPPVADEGYGTAYVTGYTALWGAAS
jgi:ribose transport system substrate-binding protein